MSTIRVLTLGWEFPPLVNGGLGIACLGLSKALAKKVDLRVIVPKADPSVLFDGFQDRDGSCPSQRSEAKTPEQNCDDSRRDARYRGSAYLGAL